MSHRRFPQPLRLRVQVAYAKAWEALADTHHRQAVQFVRHLSDRLTAEEALYRYFREVSVPAAMQEGVRARALISLADELEPSDETSAGLEAWHYLRPDLMVEALRRRAQFVEETNLAARLAASAAGEAICATHVSNARAVAELVREAAPLDEAIMHYIRGFDLPTVQAHMVFQRTLAEFAEIGALATPLVPAPAAPALRPAANSAAETIQRGARATPLPAGAFGLRAIS